jgi:hypothetical protein
MIRPTQVARIHESLAASCTNCPPYEPLQIFDPEFHKLPIGELWHDVSDYHLKIHDAQCLRKRNRSIRPQKFDDED